MLVNSANLDRIFTGFKTAFNKGFAGYESMYRAVAMEITSSTKEERYGWLGQLPSVREWVGDRVIHSLATHDFAIRNRKFELTISVDRESIEDDNYGLFSPIVQEMGRGVAEHPDTLVFELLKAGFTTLCYDGQFFFDTDHPVGTPSGETVSASNFQGGSGTPWYLMDLSRPIKPLIYQRRQPFDFTRLDNADDENVFFRDEYLYGVRGRSNAGFGLWQLAYASKQDLTKNNFRDARLAMYAVKGEAGRPLGLRPTHLIIPPSLEEDAMEILNAENDAAGATNVWRGKAELLISHWLEA